MKYIFFSIDEEKYWIEIDDSGYAIRQIILSEDGYHVSCVEDCLAEGKIVENDLEVNVINISVADFNIVWDKALDEYKQTWNMTKKKYKINDFITATFAYFYPQGPIFKNKNIVIKYVGDKTVKLHDKLTLTVIGYDDTNMWLVAR